MFDNVFSQITLHLNHELRRRFQIDEDVVLMSNLLEPDGSAIANNANKLVLFLAGVEQHSGAHRALEVDANTLAQSDVANLTSFNLLMMCAANFGGNNYLEALRFLSATIQFFQERPVFNRENTPGLDARLEKLVLSIENLSAAEMNTFWNAHNGGRYVPSMLYRVRLVGV